MQNNEEIPPSFPPQKHNNISNSTNEKPIVVGNDTHVEHNVKKPKKKPNSSSSNVVQNKESNVPPTYTPLSKRTSKPTRYSSPNQNPNVAKEPVYPPTHSTPKPQPTTYSSAQNYSNNATNNNAHPSYNIGNNYSAGQPGIGNNTPPVKPKSSCAKKIKKPLISILVLVLVILIAWPGYLFYRANSQLTYVNALSDMPKNTDGTTWLIAGSDSRENFQIQDGTEGERSDSIIMVHKAANGQSSMISLPRDTMANIPGYGYDKLNSSFAYGGSELLVKTVEELTNTKVDHYVQIGMTGVQDLVDAVGGVNLCLDYDVNDYNSALNWKAGCHDTNGQTALAFARMRYADPLSDLGRADRQRQVISKLMNKVFTPSVLINPVKHIALVDAGSQSVKTDPNTSPWNIGILALAFRKARNENLSGIPPVESMNYILSSGVSTVLLDQELKDVFFEKMRQGTLTPDDFQKF